MPMRMNEPRHITIPINQATSSGVTALPIRANEWVIPCANPRFPAGVQSDIARVAVGNAETPIPSKTRATSIPANVLVSPMYTVAADQIVAKNVSAFRAPNRSLTHPPMIWNSRYG